MLFYVNKILLSAEKIEENAADITATMLDFSNTGRLTNPTGNSIMDQLQMEYSGNQEQHRKQKALTDLSKLDQRTVMLFRAANGSETMINETINTASGHRDKKVMEIKRGLITLKVIHNPDEIFLPTQVSY
jgi:hypothetical protein